MKNNHFYSLVGEKHSLPSKKIKKAMLAFLCGGTMGLLAQIVFVILIKQFDFSETSASNYITLFVIIITSLCTGIGVYDKVANIFGAGLFVPISGFANALCSSALESKNEGLIYGIGSNMFKLAGSVITYGIVSVYILGLIRYFLNI